MNAPVNPNPAGLTIDALRTDIAEAALQRILSSLGDALCPTGPKSMDGDRVANLSEDVFVVEAALDRNVCQLVEMRALAIDVARRLPDGSPEAAALVNLTAEHMGLDHAQLAQGLTPQNIAAIYMPLTRVAREQARQGPAPHVQRRKASEHDLSRSSLRAPAFANPFPEPAIITTPAKSNSPVL